METVQKIMSYVSMSFTVHTCHKKGILNQVKPALSFNPITPDTVLYSNSNYFSYCPYLRKKMIRKKYLNGEVEVF